MVSSNPNAQRARKDRILRANEILNRLDNRNFQGSVTFHFKGGEGIASHEIFERVNWNCLSNVSDEIRTMTAS